MKKLFLTLLALLGMATAHADEGMWLLKIMKEQQLEDSLRKAGLQLSPEELYSETKPSMRDVVGIFGRGCTGEVISRDGLVLTNNHCGFSYIHEISSLKNNYLQDGFFAKSRAEELRVPGLTFTFVVRVAEVTKEVEMAARKAKADAYKMQSLSFLEPFAAQMLKKSDLAKKKGISLRIVPYFGGNRFFAFYEQEYSDVRLVANPPQQIGQFGYNQDNWIWPRHTADFMVFRIYADKNGQPADYQASNQPLRCKKWMPISLRGVEEGDYAMIMGFPGRTSRYLTASQVRLRTESVNAPINSAGEAELNFMKSLMDSDKAMGLKYADQYMSLGNMVKNFGGMNESVRRTGLLNIKAEEEKAFRAFAAKSGKKEYQDIIDRMDSLVAAAKDTLHDFYLLQYTYGSQDFRSPSNLLNDYAQALGRKLQGKVKKGESYEAKREAYVKAAKQMMGTVDMDYDRRKMQLLAPYWAKLHRLPMQPDFVRPDMTAYFDSLYTQSAYRSPEAFDKSWWLASDDWERFGDDPLDQHFAQLGQALQAYRPAVQRYNEKLAELNRIYVRGLCEMYNWTKSPDANSTLRMTYGSVQAYSPRDAVQYDWKTTLKGMFEKENPNDPDYVVDEKLRQHYLTKNYGRYADKNGEMPACFLTNNDITGGNSGSAVLNARGELIGLAFDGNIESLSSDLRFNPALQRCINVDIRYVLFLIDVYGGSKYVIDELEIRD
ncbi:MAG: S46 family peptidase [Bacteroidales bacterium]|nr:S46 family peptidase [Bacteroidales bacterium]